MILCECEGDGFGPYHFTDDEAFGQMAVITPCTACNGSGDPLRPCWDWGNEVMEVTDQ